jgi:tetratricopeptide (TPR) repeat protein
VLSEFGQFDNTGWVLYQLARLRLIDGQALEAVDLLQKALLSPSRFAFLTAYCYERLGFIHLYEVRDLPQALNFLNKAVDTYPESERRTWLAQVHTLRSRVLRDQGKLDEALAAADFAVQIAAANGADGRVSMSDASLLAAELAAQIGGHDRDVVAYLNQFLQTSRKPGGIDVTWSRAHELLGDSLWRSANPQGALAAYESALQYNPYHPWELSLYYRMARCHYQMKDYARTTHALEHMFKIAERDGEAISDFRVYQLLANAYYASHNFADAEAAYERALSLAPQETDHIAELVHYMHLARGRAVGRAAPTL